MVWAVFLSGHGVREYTGAVFAIVARRALSAVVPRSCRIRQPSYRWSERHAAYEALAGSTNVRALDSLSEQRARETNPWLVLVIDESLEKSQTKPLRCERCGRSV